MTVLPRWLRTTRDMRIGGLVLAGLALFFAVVYVIIVLGGGLLIGQTDKANIWLSVAATLIVALFSEPLGDWLDTQATRLVYSGRPSPYEVLRSFTTSVAGVDDPVEVPARMAQVLAEGTGAEWTQVWLLVDDEPQLAAMWPPDSPGLTGGRPGSKLVEGRLEEPIMLAGEKLGVLRLQHAEGEPLTPVEEKLFAGLAAQAGPVVHGIQLRAELSNRVVELSRRAEELRHSRERLVDAYDDERRRLERDIHDGAQQHLVALTVNLRLAETIGKSSTERARVVLADQAAATDDAIATLVDLSRGIYPGTLTLDGIGPALGSAATNSPVPVEVRDRTGGLRLSAETEAAVYFCCLEAVQNAAKHADASNVVIEIERKDDRLTFCVEDDGCGFDPAAVSLGSGLANMRDRIDAVGGRLRLQHADPRGTRVVGWVPAHLAEEEGAP